MADHAHSTGAPTRALLPFVFRPSPPVDDPRSAGELLAEIATEIERQSGVVSRNDTPELPPEPLLPAADHARILHLRRQLAQAAEHGAALLASLGLPRLVTADFIQIDPVAAGDALEQAIATLDAFDAPDEDREPWLADTAPLADGYALDAEDDSEENEGTALESFGKGFVRVGADDTEDDDPAEESDPAERDDDHGTEDEPSLWRFERPDAVQRAAWLCEVARHV